MKNIYEVLHRKEAELQQIQKEVDALRIVIQLLADETEARPEASNSASISRAMRSLSEEAEMRAEAARPMPPQPVPLARPAAVSAKTSDAGWDSGPRQFP